MKLNYRPEIDGLRCLAVISVILYHAQIVVFETQIFKGGFLGVDIFFVISGYLITSIILKELATKDKFQFINFYKRRAKRILPALFFVILVSIPFSWVYLYPADLVNFSKSILYSLGFISNFYFYFSGLEYGSPEGLLKPFLHTWSLSVEEQFYLIFPVVLILIWRYFQKYLVYFLFIALIFSITFADWSSKNHVFSSFYFFHTRIWELVSGSIIAYFEIKLSHRNQNKILSHVLPILGLVLIIYSMIYFDSETFHPSFYTLTPVIGVMLILWFTNDDIVSKILSYKIFVGVGLISYSLYLWHFPIFSFAKNLDIFFDDFLGKFYLIFISFILSLLSYFYVEQPARKTKHSMMVFALISLVFSIIFLYSITVITKEGFTNRVKVKNYQEKHSYLYLTQQNEKCFGRRENFCSYGTIEKKIIILGDSHLGSISYNLYNRVKSNYSFLSITSPNYFHLSENIKLINKHTKKVVVEYDKLRNRIDKILKNSKNNIIIIGGATSLYFYNKRIKNRALHSDTLFVDKDNLKYDTKMIKDSFIEFIKELSLSNDVILLYPIPEVGVNLQKKKFENMVRVFNYKFSDFLYQNKEVIDFFDSIDFPRVYKVYPHKAFCGENNDLCSTHDNNNFFFFDGYHPSLEGSRLINNLIIDKINLINEDNSIN
jgi:peptidoglycan/LPS O-acetylase OafA/YrhL